MKRPDRTESEPPFVGGGAQQQTSRDGNMVLDVDQLTSSTGKLGLGPHSGTVRWATTYMVPKLGVSGISSIPVTSGEGPYLIQIQHSKCLCVSSSSDNSVWT